MNDQHKPGAGGVFGRYRLLGPAFALAFLFLVIAEFASNFRNPIDRDFISFWGAARLALAGTPALAYDAVALREIQLTAATFQGQMPFPYPPAFLLLVLPFGLMSFPVAIVAWTFATFAAYFAAARRMFPHSGWLPAAFPPVLVNAVIGQNAFVTAGIFIAGMLLLPKSPFLAGLVLGCLIIKPQLGVLLPIAFIAVGQWRAVAGAATSSLAMLVLGLVLFGTGASLGWIGQLPLYASIAQEGLVGWHKLASVYASLRQAGLALGPALTIHIIVALAAAAVVWRVWRSSAEPLAKASALAAATMLASPYLFLYDALILIVPFCWLALRGTSQAWLAPIWCLPLLTIAQTYGFNGPVNLNPVVPIALLILVYRAVSSQELGRVTAPAPAQ